MLGRRLFHEHIVIQELTNDNFSQMRWWSFHLVVEKMCLLSSRPSKHTTSFRHPNNIHNVKTTSYGCQNNVVWVLGFCFLWMRVCVWENFVIFITISLLLLCYIDIMMYSLKFSCEPRTILVHKNIYIGAEKLTVFLH